MKKTKKPYPSDRDILFSMMAEICSCLKLLVKKQPEAVEYYDTSDVMRILKVSESTVYRLRKSGQLEFKKSGKKIYYTKASVEKLMK